MNGSFHLPAPSAPLALPVAANVSHERSSGKLAAWVRLCRPPTLLLGLAPAGATLALLWATGRRVSLLPAICLLLSVLLVMSGASMLDEYLEFERNVHRRWDPNAGGSYYAANVLEGTGIEPMTTLRASILLLALGLVVGLPLLLTGGAFLLGLGLLGLIIAFLYSSTNYALKRLPAGEFVILLALGPGLVTATALSQAVLPTMQELLLGLAFGLFAFSLVLAAHLRDRDADRAIARKTLVQLNGERGSLLLYSVGLIAAYALVSLAALPKGGSHGALLAIFSLPATLVAWTGVMRATARTTRHLAVRAMLRAYASFALWTLIGLLAAGVIVRLVPFLQQHL